MTAATGGAQLADTLAIQVPEMVMVSDEVSVLVEPDNLWDVCSYLKTDDAHRYDLLNLITAVDYVEYFEVVYHLTSITRNATAVLKVRCYSRAEPTVPSICDLWRGALMHEQEAYDLMGIVFTGHPDLRRILLWEGFEGHPLRRDYLEPPLPYKWPHGG